MTEKRKKNREENTAYNQEQEEQHSDNRSNNNTTNISLNWPRKHIAKVKPGNKAERKLYGQLS